MSKPVLEDVFRFSGRRNRKSYFLFSLVQFAVACGIVFALLSSADPQSARVGDGAGGLSASGMLLAMLALLPLSWASWAVSAQRCRDFGWTGWAVLLAFIPVVGGLFFLALFFIPGTAGGNQYGEDPRDYGYYPEMA